MALALPFHLRLYQEGDLGGYVEDPSLAVLRGPVGAYLDKQLPETEATLPALGLGVFSALGAVLGRQVTLSVGNITHRPNLYSVVVGTSSKARKGTADRIVRQFAYQLDKDFAAKNVTSGFASGEAAVKRIADPQENDQGVVTVGTSDQRLLVLEPEYARVIRACEKAGSTYADILRHLYDGVPVENNALGSGHYRSTNHSVSYFSGTTPEELTSLYTALAATNGLGNRNTWGYSHSEKDLPFGGEEVDTYSELERLRSNIEEAKHWGTVGLSQAARDWWGDRYSTLKHGTDLPPSIRPMLARRTDHVSRFALNYAVSEGEMNILVPHFEAAMAWVDHSAQTVQAVLGGLVRDPAANKMLASLRSHPGLPSTRDDLYAVFGRHATAAEIDGGLTALKEAGLAHVYQGDSDGGRPPWLAIATMPIRKELKDAA